MTLKTFQKLQGLVLPLLNHCSDISFGCSEQAYEALVAAGGELRRLPSYDSGDKVISVVRLVVGDVGLEAQILVPITDEDRAKEAELLSRSRDYSLRRAKDLEARIVASK